MENNIVHSDGKIELIENNNKKKILSFVVRTLVWVRDHIIAAIIVGVVSGLIITGITKFFFKF